MTRVKVFPADRGGCGFYRIIWPAEALKAQGADVQIVYDRDPDADQVRCTWWEDEGGRTMLHAFVDDCDVAVLQRPLTDTLANAVPILQRQGVKVVVEIDDDFEAIHPRNISFRAVHPRLSPRRNWRWLRQACDQADLVVVSTPALADVYGRHGRVVVVPNYVPESYLWWPRVAHEGLRVGWSGSLDTHPEDLQVMGGAVAQVIDGDVGFHVVGTGKGVRRVLGVPEVLACGWKPIEEYPAYLAELDVGVVPLKLDRFNEAKSWLKGLEFAALGTPFVASPTGEYCRLAKLGVGVLAERPKDWARELKRLVSSEQARVEAGEWAREVAAAMTIEAHCQEWWDAWSSVVNAPCHVG